VYELGKGAGETFGAIRFACAVLHLCKNSGFLHKLCRSGFGGRGGNNGGSGGRASVEGRVQRNRRGMQAVDKGDIAGAAVAGESHGIAAGNAGIGANGVEAVGEPGEDERIVKRELAQLRVTAADVEGEVGADVAEEAAGNRKKGKQANKRGGEAGLAVPAGVVKAKEGKRVQRRRRGRTRSRGATSSVCKDR